MIKYGKPFSNFAFKLNLRRYTSGTTTSGAAIASLPYDLGVSNVLIYVPSPPFGRSWQMSPTSLGFRVQGLGFPKPQILNPTP
jgi:hypothetical protein